MNILGIDYGDKKIGLAKSAGNTAVPLAIIKKENKSQVLDNIKNICQQEEIEKIIIGVPLSLNTTGEIRQVDLQNNQMKKVLSFVDLLKKNLNLPIETEDERLTTQMASKLIKNSKKSDDDVAAMLILQNYLDKQN